MSEFHRILLGLHAEARRIDRDQALLGALGVGAFAYTHQIDSVHRMVTGTACRWLLADEVGLGKTIQAIMVMRALAAQSPRPLTAALVVPDDLVSQWEEELLCRGHVLALESGEEGGIHGNLVMRLVRPSRLLAGGRIAVDRIDLLLVDEFTKLQVQVREDLITAARTIPNVIAMTATPALHHARTRRELMALLEPEADRIARAEDGDILKVLADREARARHRYSHDLQEAGKRRAVEESFGLYRRLIRVKLGVTRFIAQAGVDLAPGGLEFDSAALIDHLRIFHARNPNGRAVVVAEDNTARTDYPDALPKRSYQPIKLTPTDGDVERARATRSYLDAARAGNLDIRREALCVGGCSNAPVEIAGCVRPLESNILTVLEGTGVFLRSEVFDESEWQEISDAIGAAADGVIGASWGEAAKQAKSLGDSHDEWLEATSLPPSPRTALAARCEARFRNRRYAAPRELPEGDRWNWFQAREHAAEAMIKLAREDFLEVRSGQDGDQRFRTMWYKVKPGSDDLTIPDLDTRNSWYRQAFISRRTAIECPPRTNVVQSDAAKRRLHFFDHGCDLHDGAVAAFEKQAPATDISTEFIVEYPVGHPILQWANRRLLVAASEVDLRDTLAFDASASLGIADGQASRAEQDARVANARITLAQFEADRRWVIDLAPPEMLFVTLVEDGGEIVVAEAGPAVFDPIHEGKCARQIARRRSVLSEPQLRAARTATATSVLEGCTNWLEHSI